MQKRQKNSIILCWLAYTVAYLGRYTYNSNITLVESEFGLTHGASGLVTTCFFFAYGIGQVVNGILCKRYNKKYIIPFALCVSALVNLSVFLGIPFQYYKYLWVINGFVQSILWPSIILLLSINMETENLKRAVIVISTPSSVGTIIIYGLSSIISFLGYYKLTFAISCICMLVVAVIWLFSFDNNMENNREEDSVDNKNGSPKTNVNKSILALVSVMAIFAILNNITKDGLHTWVPAILKEDYGLGDSFSIILSLVLPILGVFGAITATFLNKLIKNYVYLVAVLFGVSAIFSVFVLLQLKTPIWVLVLLYFGIIVLMMHAINSIITSLMPMYLRDKVNTGLISGVLNGFCYLGSTISSYGLGNVADNYGWNGVFILLTILCAIPIIISVIYWFINKIGKACSN